MWWKNPNSQSSIYQGCRTYAGNAVTLVNLAKQVGQGAPTRGVAEGCVYERCHIFPISLKSELLLGSGPQNQRALQAEGQLGFGRDFDFLTASEELGEGSRRCSGACADRCSLAPAENCAH